MGVFDDVVIVEYRNDEQAPQVTWRYLTDPACAFGNRAFTFPVGLAAICAPAAGKCQKRGMEFTFTISDGRERQQYGYVKQLFLAPDLVATQVVCILGTKPLYVWFSWILRLFHARMLHDPSHRTSIMSFLNSIRRDGGEAMADFSFRDSLDGLVHPAYIFPLYPPGAFGMRTMEPHILHNRSYTNKLKCPTVLLLMLSALLHEQRILIVHDERDVLRGTCLMLLRLLAPFVWKHLLIPVLPSELIQYIQAPIPYLMGITPSQYAQCTDTISNAIVFNLLEERLELRQLTTGFVTLCDECPTMPASSSSTVVFSKLSAAVPATPRNPSSPMSKFRHDMQHAFANNPDGMEACVNALFYSWFADTTRFLRWDSMVNQWTIDGLEDPFVMRFLHAFSPREIFQTYCKERRQLESQGKPPYFHGPMHVSVRRNELAYDTLRRALQRRATYVHEYPSIVQILSGFCGDTDRRWSSHELRPLADASYHMDQCGLMVDLLWERLGETNAATLAGVLQMLVYLALHGCEIVMEYIRFKECQRDHCQFLKGHPFRPIVDRASLLLEFMAMPHRWFAMRASHGKQLWLTTVVFPRVEVRPPHAIPAFEPLHHAVGRFHQPVQLTNLLDLDFDQPAALAMPSLASFPVQWN
ncbi:hypothetical protein LEN26_016991 [Aphanomyces euteiches]|nr:hypothetical protein LEN26_016991 [Aphanomyces euteiches]